MSKITESDIETLAVECLEKQGFAYSYGPTLEPRQSNTPRRQYTDVLLADAVKIALERLNPQLNTDQIDEAFKLIERISSTDLLTDNEQFHRYLTEGIPLEHYQGGEQKGDLAWLIDFDTPANNQFEVINQVTVHENNKDKRPDVVLFINGLPLVVLELKNAASESATMDSAFRQIKTYQQDIPKLFIYNAFTVISDGLEAKVGTISSDISRYMAWKTADGETEAARTISQLETLIQGLLNQQTLLDMIKHFIVFEKSKKEDPVTGQISIFTVKKVAAYHQYYAVNAAVISTLRAAAINSDDPLAQKATALQALYGERSVQAQTLGDRKAGVVWHTQGSGKSLSMVFYTGKIVQSLNNPTVVILTDRNDLDDQLFDTFAASAQLLRQVPKQAETSEQLKTLLKVASGGVVFTTIQKFHPADGGTHYETLSERRNIVVIADEAHRTQYGFQAKEVDVKENGEVVGKRTAYGFAKYMRDALPNATYLGFTGTPIEKGDVNTPAVFGHYVDIYDISQAVEDGATVRIYYESRLAKIAISEEGKKLIKEFDDELDDALLTEPQKAMAKAVQLERLIGSTDRVANVAQDIVNHFEQRLIANANQGKGMIVAMSRRIAVDLYNEIIRLKPEWHSDEIDKGAIKVVMTASSADGPVISKHHTTKTQRKFLAERMKDADDELKLVIVRDMWLTGFDSPCMHTLYIDKPMKGHSLMQAIARVNRVYPGKDGGLVVDYLGIAADLKEALSFYASAGGKGDPAQTQEEAVVILEEKLEVLEYLLEGFNYHEYFTANTSRKLSIILEAEDFILGLEDGRKRFIAAVTILSQAYALAVPHERAMAVSVEVAFFQAVKARLIKFISELGTGYTDAELEAMVKQTIDSALVSDQVVDIFDAAGIKKPDISILSDEFMEEMKNYQHKNIAIETLKKLLNDEIVTRETRNVVEGKKLMAKLEDAIKRYQQKIITSAEVIQELIDFGKIIVESDNLSKAMGLTDYEYAFYTAVANNDSARKLMENEQLRALAIALTHTVRSNMSIDWTLKESVRSKLKVAVKRLLRKYGYPPDMQLLATETVLEQAERLAEELSHA